MYLRNASGKYIERIIEEIKDAPNVNVICHSQLKDICLIFDLSK